MCARVCAACFAINNTSIMSFHDKIFILWVRCNEAGAKNDTIARQYPSAVCAAVISAAVILL